MRHQHQMGAMASACSFSHAGTLPRPAVGRPADSTVFLDSRFCPWQGLAVESVGVVADPHTAATLLQPARLKLLRALAEPNSAAGLAAALGEPRQRINYHLRALEDHGLVTLVEERRKGNCIERVLRASARSYVVSPDALGGVAADPAAVQDRFSTAYLLALAARVIRDVTRLRRRAERASKRLATLSIESEIRFRSAADRAAFAAELTEAIAGLAARYHAPDAPGGRAYRLVLAAHPAIDPDESLPGRGGAGEKPEETR